MMDNTLFDCRGALAEAKAETAALREALEAFRAAEDHRTKHRCINMRYCDTWSSLQNTACLIAIDAFATDAGQSLLERLRQAEAERDDLRAKLLSLAEFIKLDEGCR